MFIRIASIILVSLFIFAMCASIGCQPVTVPTCDTVRITDTVVVHVPAKLEYVKNQKFRFGQRLHYYYLNTDSGKVLLTDVELYNGLKRARENPEDLPVDMATDGPIAKPKPFSFTGGAIRQRSGQHTLRSDCLTCHKN